MARATTRSWVAASASCNAAKGAPAAWGAVAAGAVAGGAGGLGSSLTTQAIQGDFSLGRTLTDTALGAAGGGVAGRITAGITSRAGAGARGFQLGDLPEGVLGSTDEFGNITIQRGLTGRAFEETLRHETVHSVLAPPAPLNRLAIGLYGKSGLYRYAEEALAEGYTTRSLLEGLQYPVSQGYVSIPRLATEGGVAGAAGYAAYEWAK